MKISKLKVDKKGNILREDKTVLGAPIRTGKIYRSGARTGRIDLESGKVYNLKEQLLGEIDISCFGSLFDAKIAKIKEAKAKEERRKRKNSRVTSDKIEPLETKKEEPTINYIPGKDSYLVVTGRLGRIFWPHRYDSETNTDFITLNKSKGGEFLNWIQLSAKADLSDAELIKFQKYIDWYTYLKFHPGKSLPQCLLKYKTQSSSNNK